MFGFVALAVLGCCMHVMLPVQVLEARHAMQAHDVLLRNKLSTCSAAMQGSSSGTGDCAGNAF